MQRRIFSSISVERQPVSETSAALERVVTAMMGFVGFGVVAVTRQ